MLLAEQISKTFGEKSLVSDVSLMLQPGSALAIMGPNGAGKTVLLKAISLVDPPTTGRIKVDTNQYHFPPARNHDRQFPWPKLTFVFQQLFLWPHLTVRENITLPAQFQGEGVFTEERVNALISRLDIVEIVGRYPNQISGGQKQRVALARALMLSPKWLLLDEPTAALDVEQIKILIDILLDLKSAGTGIIFSTHLSGFAASVADRVAFLDQGRIVEEGGREILATPVTDRLRRFLSIVQHRPVLTQTGTS